MSKRNKILFIEIATLYEMQYCLFNATNQYQYLCDGQKLNMDDNLLSVSATHHSFERKGGCIRVLIETRFQVLMVAMAMITCARYSSPNSASA